MSSINESTVEDAALDRFKELGYAIGHAPHLAPGERTAERASFGDVVLVDRLREAIRRLNPPIFRPGKRCKGSPEEAALRPAVETDRRDVPQMDAIRPSSSTQVFGLSDREIARLVRASTG